jgi:beta-glucosidase
MTCRNIINSTNYNAVLILVICVLLVPSSIALSADERPLMYQDPNASIEKRINDLLPRLTLEEKAAMVYANSTFSAAGAARLGIPDLWMDDGPMGVREEVGELNGEKFRNLNHTDDFATAMPATLGLAATWNLELANDYGAVIGREAFRRRKNIMLGPSLNIQRTPLCGRNFEYMGEDPFLTSRMAIQYIKGEQAQGVGSCAKHFAANNQEYQRGTISVVMDERSLQEIYLPAFRASVQEADVLTVMGAYNKFRGQYCCQNEYLLNKVLKDQWGFKGIVISDWGGVHNTGEAAMNGLDLEMGTRTSPPFDRALLGSTFLNGLKLGYYPVAVLDDKIRRRLYVMFRLHMFDNPPQQTPAPITEENPLSTKEHQATARKVAEESIVLLKNSAGLLPLDAGKIKTLAVIGDNANTRFAHSGGAANVKAPYEVTALEGIQALLGDSVKITYAQGYKNPPYLYGSRGAEFVPTATALDPKLVDAAVAAAKAADAVIYVGGLNHNRGLDDEGGDRRDLKLPYAQDQLIQSIVAANPKTAVILIGGGAVDMNAWLPQVSAVLYAWYPGMEGGNALARVLFGDANPSGKLPCTFPKVLADSPAHALDAYPGSKGTVEYKEGLLVGYRWFDAKNIEPLFPFGHGLSYTKFDYSDLKLVPGVDANVPAVTVRCVITNTGRRDGAEIVELYVHHYKPALPRPDKELKGFQKVFLKSGEKKTVSIPLDFSAFAYYAPDKAAWVAEQGNYTILLGSSCSDIRLKADWKLPATTVEK